MRKLTLLAIAIAISSCGYSIKSEQELKTYEYQTTDLEQRVEDIQILMNEQELFSKEEILRTQLEFKHYKDSVSFMELQRIMCYQTSPHRHSCEIYK